MAFERDRVIGHRVRPARRARWRLYAPSLTTFLLAAGLFLAADSIAQLGARATLGSHASLTIAAGLTVLLAALAAALCDGSAARWYIGGALAVSLGANLAPTRWLLLPLAALGLAGVLVRELQRFFDGLTLGSTSLTLHRPLKDPLTVAYDDVDAIHTSPALRDTGTLILETAHGTVTARDLPGVGDLQARIEARTSAIDVEDPESAARQARKRIQTLVQGRTPS